MGLNLLAGWVWLAGAGQRHGHRIEDPMPRSRRHPAGRRRVERKRAQTACKPGPVPALKSDGWPFVWDVRCRTPRATYPGGGAETRLPATPKSPGRPPLFGLAPGGVYHAVPVAGDAVRSYRTLSPLPAGRKAAPAVCFLWHFPWGRPRRALPGTVLPWSPDFPPPTGFPRCEGRPSSRLAQVIYRESGPRAQSPFLSYQPSAISYGPIADG